MNFGKWMAVVFLGLGCTLAAHAQFGVYFGYTGERLGGIPCKSFIGTANNCSATTATLSGTGSSTALNDAVNPSGIYFGGYYDFKTIGPVRLGASVRYYDAKSNKSASTSAGGPNATSSNTAPGCGSWPRKYEFDRRWKRVDQRALDWRVRGLSYAPEIKRWRM
jgi:hypothetical protein